MSFVFGIDVDGLIHGSSLNNDDEICLRRGVDVDNKELDLPQMDKIFHGMHSLYILDVNGGLWTYDYSIVAPPRRLDLNIIVACIIHGLASSFIVDQDLVVYEFPSTINYHVRDLISMCTKRIDLSQVGQIDFGANILLEQQISGTEMMVRKFYGDRTAVIDGEIKMLNYISPNGTFVIDMEGNFFALEETSLRRQEILPPIDLMDFGGAAFIVDVDYNLFCCSRPETFGTSDTRFTIKHLERFGKVLQFRHFGSWVIFIDDNKEAYKMRCSDGFKLELIHTKIPIFHGIQMAKLYHTYFLPHQIFSRTPKSAAK